MTETEYNIKILAEGNTREFLEDALKSSKFRESLGGFSDEEIKLALKEYDREDHREMRKIIGLDANNYAYDIRLTVATDEGNPEKVKNTIIGALNRADGLLVIGDEVNIKTADVD